VLTDGDTVAAHTAEEPMRFLFFTGKPLAEPIAWRGPIVMNTAQELDTAFREYQDGTFIKPA
jgi:quercetin 2,3-dioxygenase